MPQTRGSTACPLIGHPQSLPRIQLPTGQDVLRYYLHVRRNFIPEGEAFIAQDRAAIARNVAKKVMLRWEDASLQNVIIKEESVAIAVRRLYDHGEVKKNPSVTTSKKAHNRKDSYMEMKKHLSNNNVKLESKTSKDRLKKFNDETFGLFDISVCKTAPCLSPKCKCNTLMEEDRDFLEDQRQARMMYISHRVDTDGTMHLASKQQQYCRKKSDEESLSRRREKEQEEFEQRMQDCTSAIAGEDEDEGGHDDDRQDPDFEVRKKRDKRKVVDFSEFAKASIDQAVSTNCAVILGNALLDCLRPHLPAEVNELVRSFNYSGVYRLKNRLRDEANGQHLESLRAEPITSIYIDSKIDTSTTMITNKNGGHSRTLERQDHYTLVAEPESKFITTIIIEKDKVAIEGDSTQIADTSLTHAQLVTKLIVAFFKDNNISLDNLRLIGCDGTNSNTGWKGGLIRLLEEELKVPLQRSICLLHLNELPFKRFLATYGYGTTGGTTRRGDLGKLIKEDNMHNQNVLRNEPVPLDQLLWPFPSFRPIDRKNSLGLRNDQEMFYEYCQALIEGDFASPVFHRKAGPLSNVRWSTSGGW